MSGALVSAWVHLPERPAKIDSALEQLMRKLPVPALPRLVGAGLRVNWPAHFSIDRAGSRIAATLTAFAETQARIAVARDFELLFEDGIVGWVLHNPARYVCESWGPPCAAPVPADLGHALASFLLLIDSRFVDRLENGDALVFDELSNLEASVADLGESPQTLTLRKAVRSIIDTFYPGQYECDIS